jgi:hypothetical protein
MLSLENRMRSLWKLFKVVLAAAILIPVGMFAIAVTFGVLGTMVGIAMLLIRLACLGLVAYGVYRVARMFFGSSSSRPITPPPVRSLPPSDPYYEAAMRELDAEIEH